MFNKDKPAWITLTLVVLSLIDCVVDVTAQRTSMHENASKQSSHYEKSIRRSNTASNSTSSPSWKYSSSRTKRFEVHNIPGLDFDYGELYSGLIPTGNDPDRALFYAFNPITNGESKDLVIWLNGGPGCSSLNGFLQENGPFIWQHGMYHGLPNPYSWTNLTNMLWVEYPVGTGFSIGNITATSQEDIAKDFIGFFKNFQEIFGISNYNIYVTGESYSGRYVPYIASAMLDQNDTTNFNLSGILIYDPVIGPVDRTNRIAAYPFVRKHSSLFNFNQTFVNSLEQAHKDCGYEEYIEKYLTFPPPELQPIWNLEDERKVTPQCDIIQNSLRAALRSNPCFNMYHIPDMCPLAFDPLGVSGSLRYTYSGFDGPFFDRRAVKEAINAPLDVNWTICRTTPPVFIGPVGVVGTGDTSAEPIQHVLPRVIEHTNRVLIGEGEYDYSVLEESTLLSIQNMTWNGKLGFQSRPTDEIYIEIPDLQWQDVFIANGASGYDGPGQGLMGTQHYERGLMWVFTLQAGHMQPQYQPRVSYRHLEWLLGKTDKI